MASSVAYFDIIRLYIDKCQVTKMKMQYVGRQPHGKAFAQWARSPSGRQAKWGHAETSKVGARE
jgi:hypothetical protein